MPKPRPSRPPAPTPAPPELIRLVEENWPLIQWKEAVNNEAWRLVRAGGGNRCGAEQYNAARRSLIEQGVLPPPGFPKDRY
ncbi:MAG: hypothetical protein U1C74_00070 [Phenylobacterium sp.]|uniref:hypothetical protein n=1 Tax=Brevundimonas sp. TaxID=1871086 RepID=UPI002737C4F3|nr:hypothetical protein [Brevundimonas sp.]MDP3801245.1 hypothetical protein [Brevundimonas sp.]MDZ4369803.1 hypothetical protein [Phenylobacterium sp.]